MSANDSSANDTWTGMQKTRSKLQNTNRNLEDGVPEVKICSGQGMTPTHHLVKDLDLHFESPVVASVVAVAVVAVSRAENVAREVV